MPGGELVLGGFWNTYMCIFSYVNYSSLQHSRSLIYQLIFFFPIEQTDITQKLSQRCAIHREPLVTRVLKKYGCSRIFYTRRESGHWQEKEWIAWSRFGANVHVSPSANNQICIFHNQSFVSSEKGIGKKDVPLQKYNWK